MLINVEINDQSKTGKSILHLLKDLAKTSTDIHFIDSIQDDELLEKMNSSRKSGKASRREVEKILKAIIAK